MAGDAPGYVCRWAEVSVHSGDALVLWSRDLKQVRRILLRTLKASEKFRGPLTEALELLENLDDQLHVLADASGRRRQKTVQPLGRYQPKRYAIERRRRGIYLCEYRVGGRAQAFCCPQESYDATAETLATLDDWTQFDDVKSLVSNRTGHAQPDYLVRLCLRFWQATDPLIVEKDRTFYRSCVRGSFRKAAKRAWCALEESRGK